MIKQFFGFVEVNVNYAVKSGITGRKPPRTMGRDGVLYPLINLADQVIQSTCAFSGYLAIMDVGASSSRKSCD